MVASSQSKKKKAKHKLSSAQAADYLRQLADQLESGQIKFVDQDAALEGVVKLKESYKAKPGKAAFKVRLELSMPTPMADPDPAGDDEDAAMPDPGEESPAPAPAPEPVIKPAPEPALEAPSEDEDYSLRERLDSYKKLKKRMAKDMKLIGKILAAGKLPSLQLAEAFTADCRHMTSFAGKGDPIYPRFRESAQAFMYGVAAENPALAKAALDGLKQQRRDCHKQFK